MADLEKDAQDVQDKSKDKTGTEPGKSDGKDLDNLTPEELEEALKKAGLFKAYEKAKTSDVDKRVTQAVKTVEERVNKEWEDKLKKDKEEADAKAKADQAKDMTDAEKKYTALEEKFGKLSDMFSEYMGKEKADKLKVVKLEALRTAELPESWVDRVRGESPDEIAKDIEVLAKDFTTVQQKKIDEALEGQNRPFQSQRSPQSSIEAQIDELVGEADAPLSGPAAEQLVNMEKQ